MNLRRLILDGLKKKFEGLDEKVLNRIARIKSKDFKTEEEANKYLEDVTIQEVIDSYTDSRVTESIGTYEKKYGLKDGKKVEEGDGNTDEPENTSEKSQGKKDDNDHAESGNKGNDKKSDKQDEVPAWVKQIMDGQTRLNERLDAIEKGKTADARKARFNEIIKNAPDKFKERAEKRYNRFIFKDDDDFDDYLDDLEEEVAEASKSQDKSGVVSAPKGGTSGKGGGSDYKPSPAMQARIDANKQMTRQSVLKGLPVIDNNNQSK